MKTTNKEQTMEERDFRVCPECDKMVDRNEMIWTYDCHGIPFRLVCLDCYEKVTENGYDGEYYDECDECLDEEEGW